MKIVVLSLLLLTAACFTRSSAINETQCQNVQEKLKAVKDAVEALCEGTTETIPAVRNTWISVPLTRIGSTNLRHPSTLSFIIPSVIPSTAKNLLVYAAVYCGTANRGVSDHIKIFTQDGSNKHYEKYLYMHTWPQSAVNTNSDNMWFPMPTNRRIYMTVSRDAGTYCTCYLYAVGYN